MVFYSDFGATLNLIAKQTDNCSVNNYATVYIICIAHNWRDAKYDEYNNNNNKLTKIARVSQWNRWVLFIGTLSKGKKNNYITCNSFLSVWMSSMSKVA